MVGDNMLYFLGITVLLAFNNVMAAGAAKIIPWFSYGYVPATRVSYRRHLTLVLRALALFTQPWA